MKLAILCIMLTGCFTLDRERWYRGKVEVGRFDLCAVYVGRGALVKCEF